MPRVRSIFNSYKLARPSRHALGPMQPWPADSGAPDSGPLLGQSVTAGVILGAADLAGQALEDIQKEGEASSGVDIARTIRFAFFGFILQAPWNHFYYQFLDGAIPPTADPWTPTTAIKTVIDQFVQAPIFTVLIFGFLGLLEGNPWIRSSSNWTTTTPTQCWQTGNCGCQRR